MKKIYGKFLSTIKELGYTEEEIVLGSGDSRAKIMLIGEAPGKDEVKQKQPFVGKAGKVLDTFLAYTGLDREALFITNTVKFRPFIESEKGTRRNRPPKAKEILICNQCLKEEIAALSPALIVTLGNTALRAVLQENKTTIGEMHGTVISLKEGKLFPLYHPASIIYNRALEPEYLNDLNKLKKYLKQEGLTSKREEYKR